jgi:hypothetical protein
MNQHQIALHNDSQVVFVPPAHLPPIRRPANSQMATSAVPQIVVIHEHRGAPVDPDRYANTVISMGTAVFSVAIVGFTCVGPVALLFVAMLNLVMKGF